MIIHIDMDAFFASVELRERPQLNGRPVVVGGVAGSRGVVAAASYAARQYGVSSAMPMATAQRLCPKLVCLPVNMPLYVSVSKQIQQIFTRYTPEIEPLSLDEAFLDVAASEKLFGTAAEIAKQIKLDIQNECQLIASAGVAPNKFVAKIASDIDKPDGFVVINPGDVQAFLDPLPIKRIWGVGKKTELQLKGNGIQTVYDVRVKHPDWLKQHFGKLGEHLYRLAHGLDHRKVVTDAKAKSMSSETTYTNDIVDKDVLTSSLLQLTETVAMRLRDKGVEGKTVSIKVRFHDFKTITRCKTLPNSTHSTRQLWQAVKQLFDDVWSSNPLAIRLLGVGVSGFGQKMNSQGELFEEDGRQDTLDALSDEINRRFGKSKIHRGRH